MTEHEYHETLLNKIDELNAELKKVKRENLDQKSHIRSLKKAVKNYKEQSAINERKKDRKRGSNREKRRYV